MANQIDPLIDGATHRRPREVHLSWPNRFRRQLLTPILLGVTAIHILLFWIAITLFLPVSIDISYPEGAIVARALDVAHGESPYRDWRQWPHVFAPYAPLTYFVPGTVARLIGRIDPVSLYWIGRLHSWIGLAALCAVTWLIGRRLGLSRSWATVLLGVLLFWRHLFEWSLSYRPDAVKTALALAAIGCFMSDSKRRWPVWTLTFLYLSFWYKPTAWGVLLAVIIEYARQHGTRRAWALLLGFGLAGLIPALAYNALTDGLFFLNIIDSLKNGFSLKPYRELVGLYPPIPCFLTMIGIGAAIYHLRCSRSIPPPEKYRFVALAMLATLFFSGLLMFKAGADLNYFFTPYVLAIILAVTGLQQLWSRVNGRLWCESVAWFVVLLALAQFTLHINRSMQDIPFIHKLWQEDPMIRLARSRPGPILSVHPYISVKTNRDETILDHYQYMLITVRGGINPEILADRIASQEFSLIIIFSTWHQAAMDGSMAETHYFPGFHELLNRYYYPSQTINQRVFFVPRPHE